MVIIFIRTFYNNKCISKLDIIRLKLIVNSKHFNNYLTLVYPTKKSALKAISEAKKYLRQNDYEITASTTSISYDAGSLYLIEQYKY